MSVYAHLCITLHNHTTSAARVKRCAKIIARDFQRERLGRRDAAREQNIAGKLRARGIQSHALWNVRSNGEVGDEASGNSGFYGFEHGVGLRRTVGEERGARRSSDPRGKSAGRTYGKLSERSDHLD